MFKVEIKNGEVREFSGISKRNNKPFTIRTQRGYMHNPAWEYPKECEIPLRDGREPYQEGDYMVSPTSFYIGRYGDLQVALELEPARAHNVRSAA